jgi:hypothetical protein
MAAKKSTTKKTTKKATTKKSGHAKAMTGTKGTAPKGKKSATKTAAAKKPAVKLTDRQAEFLKKIKDAGEGGYHAGQKAEHRTIESLADKKLLKRGAKHKESGHYHYHITKTGEKHLGAHHAGAGGGTGGSI